MKVKLSILLLLLITFFSGCTQHLTIIQNNDASVDIKVNYNPGKNIENLISSFTNSTQLFDEKEVKDALAATNAKDITVNTFGTADIESNFSYKNNKAFLSNFNKLFTIQDNKIKMTISKGALKQLVKILPKDSNTYLDILMAPVFTDEDMNENEYISLIAATFGKSFSEEMQTSTFDLTIISKNGKQQNVAIPLSQFLTLESELTYVFEW
ncbi:MAG: hypothetical protein K6F69_03020 [Treponema sp.]|nr:hypothetical protein [Treponema sp.]